MTQIVCSIFAIAGILMTFACFNNSHAPKFLCVLSGACGAASIMTGLGPVLGISYFNVLYFLTGVALIVINSILVIRPE